MTFGPIVGDGKQWGHLVIDDHGGYCYEPNSSPPGFLDALRHLNPHLRPDGWVDPYADLPVPELHELLVSAGL